MGHENSGGPLVAYFDGQPVEIVQPVPEITLDDSTDGASVADAMGAVGNLAAAMTGVAITMTVAAEEIQEFFRAAELAVAVNFARALEPAMAHRYLHAKKKRIRKKYEKRIVAWFREVFL